LIRKAKQFPLLTGLAIVIGGFFIFAIISISTRISIDPDHVVVTSFEVAGESDNGQVVVTIDRISHHPATNVRGIFSRRAGSTPRPEYIQIDGTIALSIDSSTAATLFGSATILIDDGVQLEREIRTRGNSCWSAGWHPMALQIKTDPGDFTIRIPLLNNPTTVSILASIEKGEIPVITIKGIYSTDSECEPLELIYAATPQEISVDPTGTGSGVAQDFYPYGEPRFDVSNDPDRQLWREWARGWVPGEF